jgi:hypothetical protein
VAKPVSVVSILHKLEDGPCDDTSTALARIPLVGYDFAKKNTIAEKGELT